MDYLDKNITTWSENLLKYKGFPRPFYYTNEKHHFKNNERWLAKKVPLPYQSMPGDEVFAIKLNIQNEKEVVDKNLCPYCGVAIKNEEMSIRWLIEKEKDSFNEERDLVPSDFHPFHTHCMKEARVYCPFMKTLKDEDFEETLYDINIKKTKNYMEKYFSIKWKDKHRPY